MSVPRIAILFACAAVSGAVVADEAVRTPPVRVFDATELSINQYIVVRRIWADTSRVAFDVPKFADAGDAVQALVAEASKAGADGLIDVHCLNARHGQGPNAYFCQGNAIRLKP